MANAADHVNPEIRNGDVWRAPHPMCWTCVVVFMWLDDKDEALWGLLAIQSGGESRPLWHGTTTHHSKLYTKSELYEALEGWELLPDKFLAVVDCELFEAALRGSM